MKGDICRISGELFLGGLSTVWNVFVSPSMYADENAFSRKIDLTAKNAWYYAKQRELSISFFVSSPMLRSFEEKTKVPLKLKKNQPLWGYLLILKYPKASRCIILGILEVLGK